MDEYEKENRDAVERRIVKMLLVYVKPELLNGAPFTASLRGDLGMDLIDFLYFMADMEDVFGVPMHIRNTALTETIQHAVNLACAHSPEFHWSHPEGDG